MKMKLLIITAMLIAGVFFVLNRETNKKIEDHLNKETKQYKILYETLYNEFQDKARIIFDNMVNTQEVIAVFKKIDILCDGKKEFPDSEELTILRNRLYDLTQLQYHRLKTASKLQQIHFHSPYNRSLLRLHLPKKYGDDLTDIRPIVAYVNMTKKPMHGFEVGRVYSGYRFVFPIKDEDGTHLGSVEISFTASIFTKEFMEHTNAHSNFHVKKTIIDQKVWKDKKPICYIKSPLKGYYAVKKVVEELEKQTSTSYKKLHARQQARDEVVKWMKLGKPFSVYDRATNYTITLIPVKSPITKEVVAYLSTKHYSNYIKEVTLHLYLSFFIISFFVLVIMFLIYKLFANQEKNTRMLYDKNRELEKSQQELKELNENLEQKVVEQVEKNTRQEKQLFESVKMASLGEMIGNISHQWRQPLNVITTSAGGIKFQKEFGTLNDEVLNESMERIEESAQYLSETIDTFRNFIKEEKIKKEVIVQDRVNKALKITSSSLKIKHIEIINNIDYSNPVKVTLNVGELCQVLINILNNAKDILEEKQIEEPWVKLDLLKAENSVIITIEDNGGGIPEDIIPKIFDQYFTTKHDGKGTGLGLHMSYRIVTESLKGDLYVQNTQNGAKFFIELPLTN